MITILVLIRILLEDKGSLKQTINSKNHTVLIRILLEAKGSHIFVLIYYYKLVLIRILLEAKGSLLLGHHALWKMS